MEREIKFRAWNKHTNRMIAPFTIHEMLVSNPINIDVVGEYIYMQFTGLTDVNGKEIYEGDIVVECGGFKGHITWYKDQGCFYLTGIPCGGNHLEIQDIEYEVIGNIHENQALIAT